jgi:hypothetical protein
MSDINKKLIKHSVIYGLILGGIQILIQLFIYIFNVNMFSIAFSLINMLISIGLLTFIMAFASVKFRNNYLEHRISFLRCWSIGLIVGLVAMLIGMLYSYVFNFIFDPDFMVNQLENFKEMIESYDQIPDDQKAKIIEDTTTRFTPGNMLLQSLIMMGAMTFFLSLLSTVFVRKKEKVAENVY